MTKETTMPNAASFTTPEQFDVLGGMDVLERWRLADPSEASAAERRHYRIWRDLDADGEATWEVTAYECGDANGEVNAGPSLLQVARGLTGRTDAHSPGGGA